jgi:O-antigen ligase
MQTASLKAPGVFPGAHALPAPEQPGNRLAFGALLLVVFVEFAQVQTQFALGSAFRPALVANIVLILAVWSSAFRVPWTHPVLVIMVLMIGYAALWVPFATNNYWAFKSFQFLVTELFFCLGALVTITTSRRLAVFLVVLLSCLLLQAVWGLTHGGRGLGGFFGDENDLALAMCVGIPYGLFTLGALGSPRLRFAGIAFAALFAATTVASMSRGGIIGLAATGAAIVAFSRKRAAIALGIVIAAGVLWTLAPASYRAEMSTIFDSGEETRTDRIVMWKNATRMFLDNPIFGVGPGNLPWNISRYELEEDQRRSFAGRAVHSIYFTLFPEWGIVGTALFVALAWYVIRELFRLKREGNSEIARGMARATLCAGVGFGAAGAFVSVLYYPYLFKFVALTITAGNIASIERAALSEAGDEAVEVDAGG